MSDGCIAVRYAVEEVAENLILAVGGNKQRALGYDSFFERPAWYEDERAGIFAIESEHFITPILSGKVVGGDRHDGTSLVERPDHGPVRPTVT